MSKLEARRAWLMRQIAHLTAMIPTLKPGLALDMAQRQLADRGRDLYLLRPASQRQSDPR